MNNSKNIFSVVWRGARVWLITTAALLVVLLTLTLVATQNAFIYGTICGVFGGETNRVVSGDPSKYRYFTADTESFGYYEPITKLASKEDALKEANNLNEKIAEEGNILLKNAEIAAGVPALPLAAGAKVSVFGKNSANIVYGGSGSSERSTEDTVDLYKGLANAGFDVNPTLKSFYASGSSGKGRGTSPQMGSMVSGFATGETPQSLYTDDVKNSYTSYKDAAIIVISRIGGEGYDLPRTMKKSFDENAAAVTGANADDHYLQLDKNEKALISSVCNGKTFDKVIVVVNCSTPMELGFIEDGSLGKIDAALWIGNPGGSGLNALGKILNGEVNPSGRTVDLYARDFKADPTWQNFGNNLTANGHEYTVGGAGQGYYYVEYEEGIYIGYRYYETRGYTDGEEWYNENVVYPFGYGLSYTTFDWEIESAAPANYATLTADGTVTVKVKVTNTGKRAGRDVVQLYYSAPYWTDEIEKPYVVLGDFAKTGEIPAGGSETVTLTLKVRDMASYDYNDANHNGIYGYELDIGGYSLFLGRNSHDAWAGANADELGLYYVSAAHSYETDAATGNKVENLFDDVSGHIGTYLSRNAWDYTMPKMTTAEEREVEKEFIDSLAWQQNDEDRPYYTEKTYEQGKASDLKLYDFIKQTDGGYFVDFKDERWDELLSVLTVEEMAAFIGQANYKTIALPSIDMPATTEGDGPPGFTTFMGDPAIYGTCFYASECVIAATFNKALARDMGTMIGTESIFGNVRGDGSTYPGWYAPAVNTHRSPFGGRNWEYYSEDGYLSGKMAANVIGGATAKGVACFVKHFALNDQETARDLNGVLTWANEQTIREIYLKPFEYAVKEGGSIAVMSSFNRIGKTWAGGDYRLCTEILRNEWGFKGTVITDYNLCDHMPADQMIRAGGDLNLTQNKKPTTANASPTQIALLRQATKNILYTFANTNAMNGHGDGVVWGTALPTWVTLVIIADCVAAVGLAAWGFFAVRRAKKKANEQ